MKSERPVVLVAMPWAMADHPSLQIGILHSLLSAESIRVESKSFFVAFALYAKQRSKIEGRVPLTISDYNALAANHSLAELVFAGPPLTGQGWGDCGALDALVSGGSSAILKELAAEYRRYAPGFLEMCADEVLGMSPSAVGFTTTLSQTVASLALAVRLKERSPSLPIVFGGANCEGEMGEGLLAAFACVDVIVQGEAESIAGAVFSALIDRCQLPDLPGVLTRATALAVACRPERVRVEMDAVPLPTFDEYFARLGPEAAELTVHLPFETARGCWWGAKSHCTFCGLNGTSMSFRSQTADRVLGGLHSLAAKHNVARFAAVDNILDHKYFRNLMPSLAAQGAPYRLFFETKANLSRAQVQLLANAGVTEIQPGIESLSTPTLQLMKKGSNALMNIRLLKWCVEFGILPHWNMIYGFPGEDPAEYFMMASRIRALVHLPPPSLTRLSVERFSPYYNDPSAYGITILGPTQFYGLAYALEEPALSGLAYSFDYRIEGQDNSLAYVAPVKKAVSRWYDDYHSRERRPELTIERIKRGAIIKDNRSLGAERTIVLTRLEAAVFEECDGGTTPDLIHERHGASINKHDIEQLLTAWESSNLVLRDGSVYLGLAVRRS